jgi:hypothetical protein
MPNYPATSHARRNLRNLRIKAALDRAPAQALSLVTSHKCRNSQHSSEPYGCANDGTTCLCECHDQPEQETT